MIVLYADFMTRKEHQAAIEKLKSVEVKPVNGKYVLPKKVVMMILNLANNDADRSG
jgi:hypothetical protein